jgi:prevent-host-death family protein
MGKGMIDVTPLTTVQARKAFSDFITRVSVQKEWVLLTRRGKPVAGAVPLEDFEYFEGREGSLSPQGMETFEDIMDKKIAAQTSKIAESQVPYQPRAADNRVRRVTSAEARNNLADVLNRVGYGKERIVVTRNGWDLFALIPPEVLDVYVEVEDLEDEIDNKLADEALREAELEGWVPWEVVKKELDLK